MKNFVKFARPNYAQVRPTTRRKKFASPDHTQFPSRRNSPDEIRHPKAAPRRASNSKTKPNRPTTLPGDSSQFITFHHNFGFTPVAFAASHGISQNSKPKPIFCAHDARDSAILPRRQARAQIQNQTQSGRHPTERFITIHHFSSQFRIYASRLPGVPRNPTQALTSPLAWSSYKAASLTRGNRRLYLGVESPVSGWKFSYAT